MHLRTELAATVFGFLALNCLLAFAAIGLFGRMGPAIERILERNDATIAAAEDLLTTLAQAPVGPLDAAAEAAIEAAVLRAQGNITEPGEGPVLQRIEEVLPAVVAGKPEARQALTGEVRELIRINREAMLSVDRQAQRLGRSGAWAAAVVGFASLLLGFLLSRRLNRRVVRPLQELESVLLARRGGDAFRRATVGDAAPELRQALEGVNRVLDELATHPPTADHKP
ncbi:MAG: hypothetical protein RL398_1706 [Planctomycetota bacterium]|jgi:methyl-accepting chemotaxis protein